MKKSLGFILALLIATGIIGIAHAVVYQALFAILTTLFFVRLSPGVSSIILYLFIFLAVSFMAATFISMKWNNGPVRIFYRFSAVWTGFLIYFFFAAFAYGVLCMFSSLPIFAAVSITAAVTVARIGAVLMVVAFFTAAYGIYNANNMRVTDISVSLSGLPAAWKNRKAVWVSDVHLGHVRGECFAKKVSDRILSLDPDIVFVGGDLYDGSKVDAAAIIEPFRALTGRTGAERTPVPLGVYFIMGNHEEFHESDVVRYAKAVKDVGMRILDDEIADVEGMQILGVDHGRTDSAKKFASVLEKISATGNFDPKRPSILLKHEPRDLEVGARAGIFLQISGHTHRGQIFPVSWITRLTFKGFDYGFKKFSGKDGKTMQVCTSSGVGTWGPPLRVGTRSEIVLINFTESEDKV